MRKIRCFLMLTGVSFLTMALLPEASWAKETNPDRPGFLVVAPDRGFLGNQEVQELFEAFKADLKDEAPSALALVGGNYNGVNGAYSDYLDKALQMLKAEGATRIVALPLFLSGSDPVLKTVIDRLPSDAAFGPLQWAAPMSESHLIAQILLDRVEALSRGAEGERLVVLGIGAMDETGEAAIRADLTRMAAYAGRYRPFEEIQVGIYYDRDAETDLKEQKNKEVDQRVLRTAAKKGRTLVLPFFIGPKFDGRMSLGRWLGEKFEEFDLVYDAQEILSHPNALLWLKKSAHRALPTAASRIGVVIMPHGATRPYNDVVEQVISPLNSSYPIQMAYGMADPDTIQNAVSRLEQEGIRRIVFVRMYALAEQFKEETDYILGLTQEAADFEHRHEGLPRQIRSAAVFSSFGGYEEDPAIAQILYERIAELSRDPQEETVILVAHGSGDDHRDARWLEVMNAHADRIKRQSGASFRAIGAATLREDWPEKREAAVARLKEMIREGNNGGRVLLISNRLYGSGPYKHYLDAAGLRDGIDYVMNGQGFAPHPLLTRWLEKGIEESLQATGPEKRAPSALGRLTRQEGKRARGNDPLNSSARRPQRGLRRTDSNEKEVFHGRGFGENHAFEIGIRLDRALPRRRPHLPAEYDASLQPG